MTTITNQDLEELYNKLPKQQTLHKKCESICETILNCGQYEGDKHTITRKIERAFNRRTKVRLDVEQLNNWRRECFSISLQKGGNCEFLVDCPPEYGDSRERIKNFTFDYCYDSSVEPHMPGYASQQLVFQDLGTEVLEAAFEGYNACVFAYGQTSTGKTYTMMGDGEESGLIPRICEGLFSRVDDFIDENFTFKVDISYLEVYNERVRDLLQNPLLKHSEKYTLKVREHPKEGPYVQGGLTFGEQTVISNMYKQKILFVLGDQLPMNYDAAISIFSVCRTSESEKMKHCITSYVNALIDIWTKAFGEGHVKDRENITKKVKQVVNHYKTHVYNEKNRTKPKKKGTPFVKKTIRILNQEWRQISMTVTKNRKPILIPINDTLNCGKDMDSLTGIEKDFYMDQTGARLGRISESIDVEYVNEKEAELVAKTAALEREEIEEEYALEEVSDGEKIEEEYALEEVSDGEKIEEEYALEEVSDGEKIEEEYASEEVTDGNYDMNSSDAQLDVSLNRSGHVRSTSQLVVVQHESTGARPKIRQTRNCTNKIKSTCTEVSVKCNISNQASRVAVQTVCSGLYGHDYYLTKEEAIEKDPSLEELRSESTAPKPPKRSKSKETVAHTAKQWKAYENVLPSTKSLNNHKQVLAIQHEKEAATALYMIQPGTKVTLHFDTTSRSKIDGDWPCLILIFSDKRRYPLRPIFFAYEDRPQIVRLIVETYNRLAATIDTDEHPVSAKMLWEKTTALMTDSVSKNLKIGEGVAENLQSLHVPIHLLCKSHPVEAFDRSNLSVLASVEKKLEFREKLQTMNPAVKSFLRGKTSIVEAAITSILSLVCHDKSAHSTNQADLFDYILQREGQVKHIAMYYERRFTKLGYSAASILQSLPYLRMVLNESHLSNQHIEIVRMFLDSEFLITELQVLAYFTHVVTLPFLYFVEVNSQEELLEMFPHLFNDLKCSAVDTLKEYRVEYPHIQVTQPTTDIAQQLLKKMCEDAATVLDRQAGREYCFGEGVDVTPRATQLHLLSPEERAGLPTNNLDAERHLSVFGKRAPVAKFRNKKFTAKGIRNDVTLFQSKTFKNEQSKGFTSIVRLLNDMEKDWVDEQKQFLQLKIQEKIEKGKNQSRYTQKCLQQCKGWNGPATSVEELHTILNLNPDNREKIVRTEISFYRDTHKADVIQQPDLFKINNISHEEQLLNLCALLGEHDPGRDYVSLPSNKDAATVLSNSTDSTPDYTEDTVAVGKYYLTLITEGKVNTWYVASCEGKNSDGTYEMDHLTRVQRGSNLKWRHPVSADKVNLQAESIIECVVDDLSRHLIKDNQEIQSLIEKANENRTTSSTHMHEHSSRSHAIVTVTFTQARLEDNLPSEIVSKVHLVDLAGSERASPTQGLNYKDRLKEGANINKSLVTLGNVIKCLAERSLMSLSADDAEAWSQGNSDSFMTTSLISSRKPRTFYVPYRDSVLTWLLKDSLGGNSKTIMISTISPASIYFNETISTLRYAQRAKSIINKPKINEDSNVTLIKDLRREIERLRDMLSSAQMPKTDPEPCPVTVDMQSSQLNKMFYILPVTQTVHGSVCSDNQKGSLLPLQESSTFLSEKLEENEAVAKQLTMHWIEKWQETQDILTESDLSIRRPLGKRSSSMGVIVDSQQPHLRGMDDDILSIGIVLYYLKEGKTLIGSESAEREQDIDNSFASNVVGMKVLTGPAIQPEHCFIQHIDGAVILQPNREAFCSINGIEVKHPTKLTQGDTILIGKTHMFRFNNPAEAAKLREFRKSVIKGDSESHRGSMDSVAASESGSSTYNCISPAPLMTSSFSGDQSDKTKLKQSQMELQLVKNKLEKAMSFYDKEEEQMSEMQQRHKCEEEDWMRKLSDMVANANQMRIHAETEISKAKTKIDKERALLEKNLEAEGNAKKVDDCPEMSILHNEVTELENIKKMLKEELHHNFSLQETKKCLESRVQELKRACQKSRTEVMDYEKKVKALKQEHEKSTMLKKQEMASLLEHTNVLKKHKEKLEQLIEEIKELKKVSKDKPTSVLVAFSEESVCYDPHIMPLLQDDVSKTDCLWHGNEGDLTSSSTTLLKSQCLVEDPFEQVAEPTVTSGSNSLPIANQVYPPGEKGDNSKVSHHDKSNFDGVSIGQTPYETASELSSGTICGRDSVEEPDNPLVFDTELLPENNGDDISEEGVHIAEDQMSSYSQDSLDRTEDEEQFVINFNSTDAGKVDNCHPSHLTSANLKGIGKYGQTPGNTVSGKCLPAKQTKLERNKKSKSVGNQAVSKSKDAISEIVTSPFSCKKGTTSQALPSSPCRDQLTPCIYEKANQIKKGRNTKSSSSDSATKDINQTSVEQRELLGPVDRCANTPTNVQTKDSEDHTKIPVKYILENDRLPIYSDKSDVKLENIEMAHLDNGFTERPSRQWYDQLIVKKTSTIKQNEISTTKPKDKLSTRKNTQETPFQSNTNCKQDLTLNQTPGDLSSKKQSMEDQPFKNQVEAVGTASKQPQEAKLPSKQSQKSQLLSNKAERKHLPLSKFDEERLLSDKLEGGLLSSSTECLSSDQSYSLSKNNSTHLDAKFKKTENSKASCQQKCLEGLDVNPILFETHSGQNVIQTGKADNLHLKNSHEDKPCLSQNNKFPLEIDVKNKLSLDLNQDQKNSSPIEKDNLLGNSFFNKSSSDFNQGQNSKSTENLYNNKESQLTQNKKSLKLRHKQLKDEVSSKCNIKQEDDQHFSKPSEDELSLSYSDDGRKQDKYLPKLVQNKPPDQLSLNLRTQNQDLSEKCISEMFSKYKYSQNISNKNNSQLGGETKNPSQCHNYQKQSNSENQNLVIENNGKLVLNSNFNESVSLDTKTETDRKLYTKATHPLSKDHVNQESFSVGYIDHCEKKIADSKIPAIYSKDSPNGDYKIPAIYSRDSPSRADISKTKEISCSNNNDIEKETCIKQERNEKTSNKGCSTGNGYLSKIGDVLVNDFPNEQCKAACRGVSGTSSVSSTNVLKQRKKEERTSKNKENSLVSMNMELNQCSQEGKHDGDCEEVSPMMMNSAGIDNGNGLTDSPSNNTTKIRSKILAYKDTRENTVASFDRSAECSRNKESKRKVCPITYIVKVNQEETNVFYNVESTDYTISNIRKPFLDMNVQQSELNTKSIQSKLKDKDGSFIDPPDSLGKLSEHTRGVHFDKTSGNISGKNLPLKTNIPKSKNNSLLSAKRTGVLVNRSFTELETHSSNGNVNEIDSVKQEIAVLDHFDQQNINSFQNKSSDQMSSNNDKKQQYTPCVPSQSQRVLQDQEDIHQYIASEIINSEKIAVDASVHLPDKKLVGKQENRASFMTENRQKTSSASDSVPKAKLNFTNNNLTCKLGLYNLRREKKLKKLTKCMSDSAISSDLTDVDSGTISPQPSHIHSWFNAQHHQQYNPHSSAGLFHLDLTGLDKSTLAPNDSQPGVTFLESLPWHEFPKSFVSSLFKVRPYALGRSISVDGLSLWVSTLEKSPNLVEELSPVVQVYSCTDNYQNVHSNNDVNETQNNQSRYPPLSSDESNFRQISHQEGLETVGCSSAPTTELQSNSSSSSTSSSSSPSSASPYMMRRQLGGSMLNFSQEEFNNLEQNLPSDISSLHSGFGGCFSEYRRTSDMDDQSLVGMNDEEEYFYFKSDGERNSKIDGHKSKVIGQRVPPNLALHRFSSSAVFLDAEDLAQEQKCPTNTNKNSWTSTDDSEETAFKYPKMPSLPSKKVNGINDRHSDFVDDNDITLYNDRSSRPYRSMKHTRLPLFQPPKSASTTDLPGDYPMSTSSYRSISPSLSSEVQVEEEDDRQKYISVGIQATQAECATQTEDETKLTSDFTMPLHGHLLKDTQTSNRLSFPFHIPFLVPETGTLHSLPALMMETTNLLKNLTKHLTVEPSLPSLTSETSPKCNISTQTDTKLQTAFSSTQPSLLYSNVQSDLRFGTTQSSPNGTCNIDHSGFYFSKPAQERSDIRIQQNIINPELNINQNTNYSNYTEPCVKTNMTPNPYSLHHQKQNMHLPLNHDTNTLGSNCSVGDTLKGDMCDSFIYHPQHHSNFKEDLQSPGQKYHSYGHQSSSPIDHTATLRSHVTNNDHKGDTIQSSQQRHWHSIPHINENNFSRQFKFNQTSPLPESNSDKYYHSMKYTNPFSTKRPWHDIINYSEYNLDSTAHDIHVEQGWTPQGTRNSPLGQGATENISNQEISGQSYGSCHLKQNLFDPENPGPPPRFRSMTFDCNDINRVKLPSYRNNTLPRAALDPYLTPTGYYSNFDRQSTPCQHYFTMPRHHKYTSASTLDFGNNSKSQFTQSEHQDLQADQYLSEELNMSLKKSGLTDEYLQLLNKSVKSLPHTKQSSLASPSDRPMHRTPNRNSMLPAYKSSNTNSRNTPVLCETIETKSYSDLSNGLATGGDHYGVAKSSGSSVFMDHSQSNDIETVLKINQQYTNMISREGKSRNSGPKSSTQRHKNNKSQKQVLDDGFKEWEQEQLDIMDMVNLKYLPVSFTVKYLEKKVNHCIAQTDLLLDSLDDDDGTTPTEMDDQATSMTDGNTEEDGSSTTSGFSAPAEQFHFPFRRQEQQTSDYSVQSRSLDSSSELSPNTWLQLQSSIPNLLTDEYTSNDSDNNTQVDSTDHVLSTDSDNGIDTRTYIQYLQSSANTSLSNSDQTIPESQDQAMNGSLGQNAISMLKEVSDFRKFYSAEIAKIRDGLYKMDEKVSAHSSSQRNRFSRQSRYNENEISNCDKRHSSCISLNASSSKSTKVKRPTVHTSSQPRHSIVDSPVAYRPQSTPLILRQRSASTEH